MDYIAAIVARLADLERRVAGMMRHGTVAEVDAAQGRVRLDLGPSSGEGRFLSPWVPYAQVAGALRAHIPPVAGQQLTLMSPSGDLRQAVAIPATWGPDNPSPSGAADANVITFGDVEITLAAGGLSISVDGVSLAITGGGLAVTGGAVTHNGTNIGDTHTHTDTAGLGAGTTSPPS